MHCTWKEAIAEAEEMGAYRVILTHFSQLYSRPSKNMVCSDLGQKTAIAFDGMLIKFKDLIFLSSYTEVMADAIQELEVKKSGQSQR